MSATPGSVPYGRTARRVEWAHLPPGVRREVERNIGAPVVHAESQGGGFTPGFASVLTDADGVGHFVKAASLKAQSAFAEAYREEVRTLRDLPPQVPAPHLLWTTETEGWVVFATQYVVGSSPQRPWFAADRDVALDLLETLADLLTPAPVAIQLPTFACDHAQLSSMWRHVAATRPGLPHLQEATALAARLEEVTAGNTLVHVDVRDDNLLLAPDGTIMLCDWNFATVGAAWIDTVLLMIGPRGDGLDVDALLGARRLTRDVPADDIDALLALVLGYFWRSADLPRPESSPHIRDFQRWQGEVCWGWLAARRGW